MNINIGPSAGNGDGQRPSSFSNWRNLQRLAPGLPDDAAQLLAEIFGGVDTRSLHLLSKPSDPARTRAGAAVGSVGAFLVHAAWDRAKP